MWWVEQAEREAKAERQARLRQTRGRRRVDQRLKNYYCNYLLPQFYAEAEVLLSRAIELHATPRSAANTTAVLTH